MTSVTFLLRRVTKRVHRRSEWSAGAAAAVPFVVGLAPFGLSVGTAISDSADPLAAWTGTLLLFSGSAQLALLQLLAGGAPLWTAIAAAVLINARLLVYSGGLAPLWAGTPLWAKALGGATLVEPTWAVAERRRRTGPTQGALPHYAGAAATLAVGWLAAVTLGTLAGSIDGLTRHLAVAVPLCLVTLVAPHLRLPGGLVAVLAGAGTAVAARAVLPGSEVLFGMAAAAVGGTLGDRHRP
jgi:predicted branched-subunit amino acid permease